MSGLAGCLTAVQESEFGSTRSFAGGSDILARVGVNADSHANRIADGPQPAAWSADAKREPLSVAPYAQRPLPDARTNVSGHADA